MSPLVINCITTEHRGFKEWIEQYNHEYIGPNVRKYVKNLTGYPSLWINPFHGYFKQDQANALFESFIRLNPILMDCISRLENKVFGCWFNAECHGELLIKLYNEHVNQPPSI